MSEQAVGTGVGKGMGRRQLIAGAAAVAAAVATRTVSAQALPAVQDGPGTSRTGGVGPRYAAGTADTVYQNFDSASFISSSSATTYAFGNSGSIAATASGAFYAQLDLPQGATITELTFALLHNVTTITSLNLYRFDANGHTISLGSMNYNTQSVSITTVSVPLSGSLTVDNSLYTYVAYWLPGTYTGSDSLFGARVGYILPGMAQVYGAAAAGAGVYGTSSTGIGVYGVSGGGASPFGVVGAVTSAPGFALYGVAGVSGTVGFAAGAGVAGAIAGQFSGPVNIYNNGAVAPGNLFIQGNYTASGTKSAAVPHPDGSHRLLYCMESPEAWFEDFGEGMITAGKAEVKLDPDFAATVDTGTLHIFLTAHDEHHLHLAGKNATGFAVQSTPSAPALAAGKKTIDLSGTFTYRVVAKRRDVKAERLAKFDLPKKIELAPPPIPTAPSAPLIPKK